METSDQPHVLAKLAGSRPSASRAQPAPLSHSTRSSDRCPGSCQETFHADHLQSASFVPTQPTRSRRRFRIRCCRAALQEYLAAGLKSNCTSCTIDAQRELPLRSVAAPATEFIQLLILYPLASWEAARHSPHRCRTDIQDSNHSKLGTCHKA